MLRRVLEEELEFADVGLHAVEVYPGLVPVEAAFLAQQLLPPLLVLVAQEDDRLEDGQPRLQLLAKQVALVVEGHVLEAFGLDGSELVGLGLEAG